MKRLLFITIIDYRGFQNNRVHHIVRHFASKFEEVVLLCKSHVPPHASLFVQLKRFFIPTIEIFKEGNIVVVELNPCLNYISGLGVRTFHVNPYKQSNTSIRKKILNILTPIGTISTFSYLLFLMGAYFFVIKKRFDICIVQGAWEGVCGLWLKRMGRIKKMVYDDNDYTPGYATTSLLCKKCLKTAERSAMSHADIVFSAGELLAQLRRKELHRVVEVIPNGVEYNLFKSAQNKKPHPPTLIYMGYIGGWEGMNLVIKALPLIKEKIPQIRLLIIGRTEPLYEKSLKRLTTQLNLIDAVKFLGKKENTELPIYLKEADIGLAVFVPIELRKYAFSLKVIEYMAAGVPIITTKGLESAEIVNKYQCGISVAFDEIEIADGVCKLLKEKERYQQYVENAKASSLQFDWKIILEKMYGLIIEM